jgi:hypothetical protein
VHTLVPHPDAPAKAVTGVTAQVAKGGPRGLWLEYRVATGGGLLLPEKRQPERGDGLWKSTCFELFVKPTRSDGYFEFNFSPSFQWAAYDFSGYRSGKRDWPAHDPEIAIYLAGDHFFLAVEALPELPATDLRIGLSAVIEEVDGTISYWALAHPPGEPDFHHQDCFALELPAAESR